MSIFDLHPPVIDEYSKYAQSFLSILDPKDVYGPDFPCETFSVLKEKEEKQYGEYRPHRLVLEAWASLETYSGDQRKTCSCVCLADIIY